MEEVGYGKYYKGIYGGLSYETHALNSVMDLGIEENGLCLKPIRNLKNGGTILSLTCTFSVGALMAIYEYLGDGEDEKKEFEAFYDDFVQKKEIACNNLDKII